MNFPKHFISAGTEYADFEHQVPAPYLRKSFVRNCRTERKSESKAMKRSGYIRLDFWRTIYEAVRFTMPVWKSTTGANRG